MKHTWKSWVSILVAAVLLLSLVPAGILTASAAAEAVYVTTWQELRDALQSSKTLDIRVAPETVIDYTFDSNTQDYRDVQITVKGEKYLAINGKITFRNALGNGAGLINLYDDTADLEVYGTSKGEFVYALQGGQTPEEGDMFYMTAGNLCLRGCVAFVVDFEYHDNRVKMHQAVIGGTGGSAWVRFAYLFGNTIFGEGIDFLFSNGSLSGVTANGVYAYQNLDLYMESGSATFEGCAFRRGISISERCDADIVMKGDKTVCVNLYDTGYAAVRNYVIYNSPCAFYRYGLEKLSPAMPEDSTLCDLGEFGLGDTIPAVEARLEYQSNGLGKELMQYGTMEVYRNEELIYQEETDLFDDRKLSYDFSSATAGDYAVYIDTRLAYGEYSGVRTETYSYRFTVVDQIAHVDVTLDKADMNSLEAVQDFADVSSVTWYEKSKTGSTWTANPTTLRGGYTYAVEFSVLSVGGKYPFKSSYTVSVDGVPVTKQANGKWRFEYVKTSYLSRIEIYDICLPAPGQHPDFIAHKDNPPYSSYEVVWTPIVDNDFGEPLTAADVFEENTSYLLEVILTADTGYEFDYAVNDEAYAYINNKKASFYYPDRNDESVIVGYVYYDTSYCINEIFVNNVQYPMPGKTPDTGVVIPDEQAGKYYPLSYSDGSGIEWCYETNPGTSAAGFSKLDGRFKTDRRHQAYVQVEASSGYWFATDNKGNLSVAAYIDGEPMAFAYSTDSYTDDGAVNKVEFARTYERAQDVDGVFVDGMWLYDGLYMNNGRWGVQTERTVDKSKGYAYYNDGVLTLHNFKWVANGNYNVIDSYRPLTVKAEGESELQAKSSEGIGISVTAPLTLIGENNQAGVWINTKATTLFAFDKVTVESGKWILYGANREAAWLFDALTVNGGYFRPWGKAIGIEGDDQTPIYMNGGKLVAVSDEDDYAISSCDVKIANGVAVTVNADHLGAETAQPWDGTTGFEEYGFVRMEFVLLLGDVNNDGKVNLTDAFAVYAAASKGAVPENVLLRGDMNEDGKINLTDAFAVYRIASGGN